MELIDRYLQAVKFWLPKDQRQDIIAELSEYLRSQFEERESALGRKLTDGDVEQMLKPARPPAAGRRKVLAAKIPDWSSSFSGVPVCAQVGAALLPGALGRSLDCARSH